MGQQPLTLWCKVLGRLVEVEITKNRSAGLLWIEVQRERAKHATPTHRAPL